MEAYDRDANKTWEKDWIFMDGRSWTGKIFMEELKKDVGEKGFIPFRFQGQYEDEETGLYYNWFR